MATTFTVIYTDLTLATAEKFDTLMSVDFGSTFSSGSASGSFTVSTLNAALLSHGLRPHEQASALLYVQGIVSRDGTVLPFLSGTYVSGVLSGSVVKACNSGSVYDEGTDLSAAGKLGYMIVTAKK